MITAGKKRNILIIGMPASYKSCVAARLSRITGMKLFDTDVAVEKRLQKNIAEIFEKLGEEAFRKVEREALAYAADLSGIIISTGGGAVKHEKEMKALCQICTVVYLETSEKMVFARLKSGLKPRPLLTPPTIEKVQQLFATRQSLYEQYADLTVCTDNKSSTEVADATLATLDAHGFFTK